MQTFPTERFRLSCRVFIHTNWQTELPARVAAFSVSRQANGLRPEFIRLEETRALLEREGETYLRRGRIHVWQNHDANSFMPVRMSAPQHANFQGRVLLLDPDIFAIADLSPLLEMDMQGKAIFACRGSDPDNLPFNTSVMLLDCAKLRHWNFDKNIERLFAHEIDYQQWAMLAYEDPNTIGILPDKWNDLDQLTSETRLLHLTRDLTQPWKTGLPVNFNYDKLLDMAALEPLQRLGVLQRRLGRQLQTLASRFSKRILRTDIFSPHPDPLQEWHFMNLLGQALDSGEMTPKEVSQQIELGNVRKDLFNCIEAAS